MNWIEWQTKTGQPITAAGRTITPQSQALLIHFPFGGFVWNRPTAVLVQHHNQTEQIPIPDITRLVQVALIMATLSFSLIVWLTNKSVKHKT